MKGITLNNSFYSADFILSVNSIPNISNEVLLFLKDWFLESDEILLQTSGSTSGVPKMFKGSKRLMEISAKASGKYFNLQKSDQVLLALSTRFIAGKMMLVRSIVLELNCFLVNPESFAETIFNNQFKFTALVPLQIRKRFEQFGLNAFDSFDNVLVGGAVIASDLKAKILTCKTPFYHSFAMTETYSHFAIRPLNGAFTSENYIPLPGIELSLDENQALLVKGEITGNNWLNTNDRAELSENGFLWKGRNDFLINSGAVKISPELLEEKILNIIEENPALKSLYQKPVLLMGVPDARFGEKLILLFEGVPSLDPEELRAYLHKKLPPFERPKAIFFVDGFEYNLGGKLSRAGTYRKFIQNFIK